MRRRIRDCIVNENTNHSYAVYSIIIYISCYEQKSLLRGDGSAVVFHYSKWFTDRADGEKVILYDASRSKKYDVPTRARRNVRRPDCLAHARFKYYNETLYLLGAGWAHIISYIRVIECSTCVRVFFSAFGCLREDLLCTRSVGVVRCHNNNTVDSR